MWELVNLMNHNSKQQLQKCLDGQTDWIIISKFITITKCKNSPLNFNKNIINNMA